MANVGAGVDGRLLTERGKRLGQPGHPSFVYAFQQLGAQVHLLSDAFEQSVIVDRPTEAIADLGGDGGSAGADLPAQSDGQGRRLRRQTRLLMRLTITVGMNNRFCQSPCRMPMSIHGDVPKALGRAGGVSPLLVRNRGLTPPARRIIVNDGRSVHVADVRWSRNRATRCEWPVRGPGPRRRCFRPWPGSRP